MDNTKQTYYVYQTNDTAASYHFTTSLANLPANAEVIFRSPIIADSISGVQSAIDNCILLYDVSNLDELIQAVQLNNYVVTIDSIDWEPMIYTIYIHTLSHTQLDSICQVLNHSHYCGIAQLDKVYFSPQTNNRPTANPAFLPYQWHLHDYLQLSKHINAINAWNYSTGKDVVVAILDQGIDLNHPDLKENLLHGYDCTDGLGRGTNGSCDVTAGDSATHGTRCAGIIGATNDSIGTIGIAYNCKMVSIRVMRQNLLNRYKRVSKGRWFLKGLAKAYEIGADIINNSWSLKGEDANENADLFDEIYKKLTHEGRYGLGTIIVQSTGNDSLSQINYPSYLSSVIAVGACDRDGNRAAFSNFGLGLDMVAPGESIYTPTNNNNYGFCSGTSMATPMVAGVAALMLSANPLLRRDSVENILKQTANKLSNYDFSMEQYPLIGSWNNEVGHGLVDAYAALVEVNKKYIQNVTYSSEEIENELGSFVYIGDSVTNRKAPGDVILNEGGNLMVQATKEIRFTDGFHAKAGSSMIAQIVPESEWKNLSSARRSSIRSNAPKNNSHSNIEDEGSISQNFDNGLKCTSAIITSTNVYSLSGFLLQTFEGENYTLSHLPSGMYILQHRMSDGSTRSEKIANNQ